MEAAGPHLDLRGDVRATATRIIAAFLCDDISAMDCCVDNKIVILNAGMNALRQVC